MKAKKIKILIVDDHAIVRTGLSSTLETHPDFSIVGEADDGMSALVKAAELLPDVVLMDLMMPGMDGAEASANSVRDHVTAICNKLGASSRTEAIALRKHLLKI